MLPLILRNSILISRGSKA